MGCKPAKTQPNSQKNQSKGQNAPKSSANNKQQNVNKQQAATSGALTKKNSIQSINISCPGQYNYGNMLPPYNPMFMNNPNFINLSQNNNKVIENQSSSFKLSGKSTTRETVMHRKWLTLKQIQTMSQKMQTKYWKWFFLDYGEGVEESQAYNRQSSLQIVESLGEIEKQRIFLHIKNMDTDTRQKILEKYLPKKSGNAIIFQKHNQVISQEYNQSNAETQKQKNPPSEQKKVIQTVEQKQSAQIFQYHQQNQVFKQTQSIDMYDNSQMSKIQIDQ